MQATLIEWLDHSSFSLNHWRDLAELQDLAPKPCTTIGFIVHETKDHLVVAGTANPEQDRYNGEMCIVKKCIVKRKKLKL